MKLIAETCKFILSSVLSIVIYSAHGIQASFYDSSATAECLAEPKGAQYGGGLIVNPKFNHGVQGWTAYGGGGMREGKSNEGNRFIVSHSRRESLDDFSQMVQLEKGKIYTFSAWIQISNGSEIVFAVFKTSDGKRIPLGKVLARHGCWSFLKGGMIANFTSPVEILFQSHNTRVEIWADSVSLKPFTWKQWRSHQDKSINKMRKGKVKFRLTYANKSSLEGATLSINQIRSGFPFGCGMNHNILTSKDYQNWFVSRFKYTTFTNEMKWYSTEPKQGEENYTIADAMVKFCKQNGISLRGHNILWDDRTKQPTWVKNLSPQELREAAAKRMNSVTSRYAGQLISWDVVNENLHCTFFEDNLGENASAEFYKTAHQLDPNTTLFLNEYNAFENIVDTTANAAAFKKKIDEIMSYPGNEGIPLGMGLQGHSICEQPNIAHMRSSLDILESIGLPIWLTEVDVRVCPNQSQYVEEVLREGYSHPAVQGIIIFGGPEMAGFKAMPLADNDFKNTPVGDIVDKLE